MINLEEIKIDEAGAKEIIDFVHDAKFNPKNQQKYFFSEAMSYYQELCKISKQIVDFQEAFKSVYANEKEIADTAVSFEQLNEALTSLKNYVDGEIISIETQLNAKLVDVEITGTGFIPGEAYIEDGVKHIEINVSSEAGGTVTSVTAGTGLRGGTITGSGTIAIDPTVVALVSALTDYVAKADATGYDDILTQTSAASTYVAKSDATGYGDILTQTDAASTYVAKSDATGYDDILTQTSAASTYVTKADATGYDDILTQTSAASTYVAKADAPGYDDILTQTSAATTYEPKSTVRNNISVSLTPSALGAYEDWDSDSYYGFSGDITINGITASSLIENILMDTSLLGKIAPVIATKQNAITIYAHTNESLIGTIYTLVTKEV